MFLVSGASGVVYYIQFRRRTVKSMSVCKLFYFDRNYSKECWVERTVFKMQGVLAQKAPETELRHISIMILSAGTRTELATASLRSPCTVAASGAATTTVTHVAASLCKEAKKLLHFCSATTRNERQVGGIACCSVVALNATAFARSGETTCSTVRKLLVSELLSPIKSISAASKFNSKTTLPRPRIRLSLRFRHDFRFT